VCRRWRVVAVVVLILCVVFFALAFVVLVAVVPTASEPEPSPVIVLAIRIVGIHLGYWQNKYTSLRKRGLFMDGALARYTLNETTN